MKVHRVYVAAAAVAIVALVAGPLVWTALRPAAECGGAAVAGADIGGPFELVSETGETVTEADVLSEPALLYFGYTFCPDVCPIDAARNAEAVDLLAEQGHDVTPIFITVDPARDTPEVLREYTDYMHPRMLGLTGTAEQVDDAAASWRVYYSAQDSGDEYYLVDHTTLTYLVMPGRGLVDFFRRDATAADVAERTACVLDSM